MSGKSYKIEKHINPEIKEGDFVEIKDGSALSCDESNKDVFIVFSYPYLTGNNLKLKEILFQVKASNVTDRISPFVGHDIAYLQDLELEYNGKTFRTCSQFVRKINVSKFRVSINIEMIK